MAATTDDHLSVGTHPDRIAAVEYFNARKAEFTAAGLKALADKACQRGDRFDPHGLPLGYLLELGAVAQLRAWEDLGLRPLLPEDVPTYREAVADLCARVRNNPLQFRKVSSATLSNRINQLWLDRFSWSAPAVLGVDVTIGQVDEDALIDALAPLLWKHRRGASGILS